MKLHILAHFSCGNINHYSGKFQAQEKKKKLLSETNGNLSPGLEQAQELDGLNWLIGP